MTRHTDTVNSFRSPNYAYAMRATSVRDVTTLSISRGSRTLRIFHGDDELCAVQEIFVIFNNVGMFQYLKNYRD